MYWTKTEYANMTAGDAAKKMHAMGYRQTSRKFGHVARVNITTKEMRDYFLKMNFGHKSGEAAGSIESQKEQYRRVYSKDTIESVPQPVMSLLRMR